MIKLFPFVFALLALSDSNSSFAVINGVLAPEKEFDAVGSLWAGKDSVDPCTATLIAPTWIVTARHCTESWTGDEGDPGEKIPTDQYEFRLGAKSKAPFARVKLKRWIYAADPKRIDTDSGEESVSLDFALGELENSPVGNGSESLEPIAPRVQHWEAADLLAEYLHIGYGQHSAFDSSPRWYGKRQLAKFRVTTTRGNALLNIFGTLPKILKFFEVYVPDIHLDEEPMDAILSNAEQLEDYSVHAWDARGRKKLDRVTPPVGGWQDTCFGDSGGPLLRRVGGKLKVVGVVSHGTNSTCAPIGTTFTVFGKNIQDVFLSVGLHLM